MTTPPAPALPAWRLVGVTYEQADDGTWIPTVRHEFYGDTAARAEHVRDRHLQTDAFLRACEAGRFGAVVCHTQWYAPERIA